MHFSSKETAFCRRLLASLASLLPLAVAACGPPRPAPNTRPPEEIYPGPLSSPASLPAVPGLGRSFALEQQVRAVYQEGEREFRAVLQLHQGRLTMVGLGPHGGRGFVLTQEGEEVRFESHIPEDQRFSPRFMLLDVHRAWLLGIGEAPMEDGEHRAEREGEEIRERWEGGRLLERAFRRLDDRPEGWIRITYEGGLGGERPPPRVILDNGWLGYRLELRTLSFQRIPELEVQAEADADADADP